MCPGDKVASSFEQHCSAKHTVQIPEMCTAGCCTSLQYRARYSLYSRHTKLLTSNTLDTFHLSAHLMPRGVLKGRQSAFALLPFLSMPIVSHLLNTCPISAFINLLHKNPCGCSIYYTADVPTSSSKKIIAPKPL